MSDTPLSTTQDLEFVALALEAAPTGMIVVDGDGRILMVNRHLEELFGHARSELVGQPIEILVPVRLRDHHPADRDAFLAAPTRRPMGAGRELHAVRRDGSEFAVEIGLNPVDTARGTVTVASVVDITERRRVAERLEASLREQNTLFRELHHRVKNNLQVVGSLLRLQGRFASEPGARLLLEQAQDRIHSIALVHEMLYASDHLSTIDLAAYLRELTSRIAAGAGRPEVALSVDAVPVVVSVEHAVPLGLVVNELVGNALKHAFPGGRAGTVRVRLARTGAEVAVEVVDDGVGTTGPARMGSQLVRTLARQLSATLTSAGPPGTRVSLTLELP